MTAQAILFLKSLYQTVKIKLRLWYCSFWSTGGISQKELVTQKLQQRGFHWKADKPTKVFAVFCVTNWEVEMLDPLRSLGEVYHFHWLEVKDFFADKAEWEVFHHKLNKDLLEAFHAIYDQEANFLIYIYASDFSISKDTLAVLRKPNTLLVSFCWDDLLYFKGRVNDQPVGVAQLSTYADINLTLSPEAIPQYIYQQSPCFFWESRPLQGMSISKLEKNSVKDFYVLFIGSRYGWRGKFINTLSKKGIPVVCYGSGWENGSLSTGEMKEAIRQAPVTLGFANVGYTKNITTIKGRDFEVPLYGGLYLTQYSEGLTRYYEPGKEILTYHDFASCLSLIRAVEQHQVPAEDIRQAGYVKAQVSATWYSRMRYLEELVAECTNPCLS